MEEDKCGTAFPNTVQCHFQLCSCNSCDDHGARQNADLSSKPNKACAIKSPLQRHLTTTKTKTKTKNPESICLLIGGFSLGHIQRLHEDDDIILNMGNYVR